MDSKYTSIFGKPVVESDSLLPFVFGIQGPIRQKMEAVIPNDTQEPIRLVGDVSRMAEPIDYERAGRIASLIHLYYTEFDNIVGGNLHIVLDDGNIEDGYVESCMADLEEANDYLGIAIAKMLIEVSVEERAQAIEAAKEMR